MIRRDPIYQAVRRLATQYRRPRRAAGRATAHRHRPTGNRIPLRVNNRRNRRDRKPAACVGWLSALFLVFVLAVAAFVGTGFWIETKLHRIAALADYADRPAAGLAARPGSSSARTAGRR